MFTDVDKALRFPTIDPEAWAKKYDLEPCSTQCHKCGREKKTTIPFARGRYRGLIAPPCPCGSESRTYCLIVAPGQGDILDGKNAEEDW